LEKFYTDFKALPGNAKYLASPLASLPMNNKMASFGALPSGDSWSADKEDETYEHLNGVYFKTLLLFFVISF